MADFTHTGLELVGRHVPEPGAGPFANMNEAQAAGYDVLNPVTGTYDIGVIIDGAFIALQTDKASAVFDRIDLAKQNAAAEAPADTSPATPPPADQTQG